MARSSYKNKKLTSSLLGLALTVIGLATGVVLITQPQLLGQKAHDIDVNYFRTPTPVATKIATPIPVATRIATPVSSPVLRNCPDSYFKDVGCNQRPCEYGYMLQKITSPGCIQRTRCIKNYSACMAKTPQCRSGSDCSNTPVQGGSKCLRNNIFGVPRTYYCCGWCQIIRNGVCVHNPYCQNQT